MRILIIEDEITLSKTLSDGLKELDFKMMWQQVSKMVNTI